MTTLYEIVELEDGEIVLRRAEKDSGKPLVSIQFSEEALYFLNESKFNVAKAMIEAGIEVANEVYAELEDSEEEVGATLH